MSADMDVWVYGTGEALGVGFISFAGLLTITAIAALAARLAYTLFTKERKSSSHSYTSLIAYYTSLLVANTLQGVGTAMSIKWVNDGRVSQGAFCKAQGGLKQAGNVGTAIWSFVITTHLFNLLFLRWTAPSSLLIVMLVSGWAFVAFVVAIGPLVLQKPTLGSYFGISGLWCWIRSEYAIDRTMLEYFIEYLSAGLSFFLCTAIVLRVRGNLCHIDGKWSLRFVPRGEGWKLSFGRDLIDTYMIRLANHMIWFPVAYSATLIPITVARFSSLNGGQTPLWAKALGGVIFNLTGFINVLLFVRARRLFPDASSIPALSTQRSQKRATAASCGVTPFTLMAPTSPPVMLTVPGVALTKTLTNATATTGTTLVAFEGGELDHRRETMSSIASDSSLTPLRRPASAQ